MNDKAKSPSSNGAGGGNSGGGDKFVGKTKSTQFNSRTLLKIGLAASVAFHFSWVARQLSSLSAQNGEYDGLLISPEYTKDHSNLYASSSSSQSPFDHRGRRTLLPSHPTPNAELQELVRSRDRYDCPEGLVYVEDHVLPDNVTHPPGRRVPYLFHVTSKSRCMTPAFNDNMNRWKNRIGSKYSIYIHDDDAMDRFIYEKRWMEFPELKEIMACVTAGVSMGVILCCLSLPCS